MARIEVVLVIEPGNAKHCGACPQWGVVGAEDLCFAFRTRLKFYDGDPGCQEHGHLRCAACINHERVFSNYPGALCVSCRGTGKDDKFLPPRTCGACAGTGWKDGKKA